MRIGEPARKHGPTQAKVIDASDLRAIDEANDALGRAEGEVDRARARLREAVEIARVRGWSWNRIAIPLGVSRQAARQRFARTDIDDE